MKKLLLLLFSILISFNSYGETLICSHKYKGELFTFKYEREGNVFKGDGNKVLDIYYEDDEYLALDTSYKSFGVYLLHFNKITKQFRNSVFSVDNGISDTGVCELIP